MRRLIFLAPILAFVALIGVFASRLGHDPTVLPSVLIGKPVPAFSLPGVRPGEPPLTSASLAQGRPRLLNVFASWCVSCRYEHPLLLELKQRGVPVDGLDWKDKPADAAAFLVVQGDPYAHVGNDESGRAGIDLGVSGAPETFVIDGSGVIRFKQVGPITPEVWSRQIEPLLARLSPAR